MRLVAPKISKRRQKILNIYKKIIIVEADLEVH